MYDDRAQFQQTPSEAPSSPWPTAGLTLQNLHRLAASLHLDDKELTPVQGWFELASRYTEDVLLNKSVMESLKREFVGVVKCFGFGATIERGAFDSIVGRVVGGFLSTI